MSEAPRGSTLGSGPDPASCSCEWRPQTPGDGQGPEGSEFTLPLGPHPGHCPPTHCFRADRWASGCPLTPSPPNPAVDRLGVGGLREHEQQVTQGPGLHSSLLDCWSSALPATVPPRFLVFSCLNRGQPFPRHLRQSCLFPFC